MSESSVFGWWIGAATLIATSLPAQVEAPAVHDFRTVDGSRFVLVPTGGAPVIHWVVATPAGVMEEPSGLEGLSYAVARAAMAGTSEKHSRDPSGERQTLADLDELEQEYDRHRAAGEEIPDALVTKLRGLQGVAAAQFDPLAWDRELRRAPALQANLNTAPDAALLHITTSVGGLVRVAQLLVERREGTTLRGIHYHFRVVREELARSRSIGISADLRREALGLSFLGHPFARAWATTDQPRPLSRSLANEVYRRTNDPWRTVHVLTGGFDPDAVRQRLEAIFVKTAIPRVPMAVGPTPPAGTSERRSTIPGARYPSVAMGYRVPTRADRDTLAVLVRWLADSENGQLVVRLRARGHHDAVVSGSAPFPVRAADLFLLEVEDPIPPRTGGPRLLDSIDAVLGEILEEDPEEQDVQRAWARERASRAAARLGGENLGYQIALAVAAGGEAPEDVLREPAAVDAATVLSLARQILGATNRTLVSFEVTQ